MPRASAEPTAVLEAAERALQAAMVASDIDALEALLDDEVVYTGPDGIPIGKAADLEAHRSGLLDVQSFEVEEVSARVIGDVGITFVEATLRGVAGGQAFSTRMRYTRTWICTESIWRVVAAHASTLG